MQIFLATVLFVTLGAAQIEGGYYTPYRSIRRTDTGIVTESMKREAELEAMQRADEMPMMETARKMRNTDPETAEQIVEVVGKSTPVRRAAAEGAVKKAVEMGAVKKSDEAQMVTRLMASPMVKQAAIEGAVRSSEEPFDTRTLNVQRNDAFSTELRSESKILSDALKRMHLNTSRSFNQEKRTDEPMLKRDSEVVKRAVEKAAEARAEEMIIEATEGKTVRAEEVKPLVNMLRNSEELRETGAVAAVVAARRMNTPLNSMYRNDLEQVKRSQLVRQAVEKGVLRAVQELRLTEPTSTRMYGPISDIDQAMRTEMMNRAVMDAARTAAGRLDMMRRAARSDSADAIELVKISANEPVVRLEAAKRAVELAVDRGIIDQRSATPEVLREVANLPSVRNAAAMGAVKKAVEMGVTA